MTAAHQPDAEVDLYCKWLLETSSERQFKLLAQGRSLDPFVPCARETLCLRSQNFYRKLAQNLLDFGGVLLTSYRFSRAGCRGLCLGDMEMRPGSASLGPSWVLVLLVGNIHAPIEEK